MQSEKAINALGIENKVEIEWQPFELNLDMPLKVKIYAFIVRENMERPLKEVLMILKL